MKEGLPISVKEQMIRCLDYPNNEKYKYKICALPLQYNIYQDCYREQLVSFFQMAPLIKKTVPIEDADYILYANPFARVEDFTESVLKELAEIDRLRKDGAEIIICGKATNIKNIIEGKYDNITYVESHFTEYLGKRFEIDMKEQYVVYDDRDESLNIWPVDGCQNQCAFCRRTYMHIPFESQPLKFLKEELDWYKNNHPEQMKYVRIRAENLTEYGLDIYGEQMLDKVIDLVDSYEEVKKIDFPIGLCIGEINENILTSICKSKKIVGISLNLEAGSDRLLKLIEKKHTCEEAKKIFQTIRKYHPDIYINTTAMIGLPTEQLEDILSLANLIMDCGVNYFHCNYYGYSSKHPLARYEQISDKVKEMHLAYLIKYIKKNYHNSHMLTMRHESIEDKSKRSVVRELERLEKMQQYHKPRLLRVTFENFIGHDISIREKYRYKSKDTEYILQKAQNIIKQKKKTLSKF